MGLTKAATPEKGIGGNESGSDAQSPGAESPFSPKEKAKVEKVFEKFLTRCQEDIQDRKTKRVALHQTYKQNTLAECTFQPKITHRGESAPLTQQIGHSLYYRGLLQSQARLERQKKRLEEVVQAEQEACPFRPDSRQEVASKYVEFVRTPRMTTPQPTPRKEPLRLDLSEELNQNARDARDLYRQEPSARKTKTGYLEASKERFDQLTKHLQEAIEANAPGEGGEIEQGAFSSPLAVSGSRASVSGASGDEGNASPTKRLSFTEAQNQEKGGGSKRGSVSKSPSRGSVSKSPSGKELAEAPSGGLQAKTS